MGSIKTEEYLKEKYLPGSEKVSIVLFEGDSELSALNKAIDSEGLQYRTIVKTNTVDSLYNEVSEHKPDIVILHIVSPEIDWLRLISGIKEIEKGIKIIVYSSHLEHKFVFAIMGAGASGYVAENGSSADLCKALDFVLNGEIYLSREILAGSDESQRIPAFVNSDISLLSEQESIVVRMISEGSSTKEIAFDLRIAVKTVETYRKRIMEKLDIDSVAGLTKFAIKAGLTSLS